MSRLYNAIIYTHSINHWLARSLAHSLAHAPLLAYVPIGAPPTSIPTATSPYILLRQKPHKSDQHKPLKQFNLITWHRWDPRLTWGHSIFDTTFHRTVTTTFATRNQDLVPLEPSSQINWKAVFDSLFHDWNVFLRLTTVAQAEMWLEVIVRAT